MTGCKLSNVAPTCSSICLKRQIDGEQSWNFGIGTDVTLATAVRVSQCSHNQPPGHLVGVQAKWSVLLPMHPTRAHFGAALRVS